MSYADDWIDCPYCNKRNEIEFCYVGIEGPGEHTLECKFCEEEFLIEVVAELSIQGSVGTKKEDKS